MRYILQFLTMAGDIAVVGASALAISFAPKDPLVWVLVLFCFKSWYETGGFEAWNPKVIRKFMENAKKYGL